MKKVLVAMSGGIDSAVAALLVKNRGYDLLGATMKLVCSSIYKLPEETDEHIENDIKDAKIVAEKLGFPHTTLDMTDIFHKEIALSFVSSYEKGETPNPCVECNKEIKFGALLEEALKENCDYIATGHYARIEEKDGRYLLKKAEDLTKDQSYFLYTLPQSTLSKVIFPLGEISKTKAREIAEENGFVNARKKDSQDICFVPDGEYINIIKSLSGKIYPDGDFISKDGTVLGTHKGIINYTVGQRKGLGIALSKPAYVLEKDAENNKVVLGNNEDLFKKECVADNFNCIMWETVPETFRGKVKIRYNHKEQWATIYKISDSEVKIIFDEPQRAIAKGQSAVIYDGDYVIGGGIIK